MKKLSIDIKQKLKKFNDVRSTYFKDANIYYSDFCLTDNKNFALFNVFDQNWVDNIFTNVLPFDLREDDLSMLIDRRSKTIKLSKRDSLIKVGNFGFVDSVYFNLLMGHIRTSNFIFLPVTEWFKRDVNTLIACLPNKQSKPTGILKTISWEEI